MGSKMVYTDI